VYHTTARQHNLAFVFARVAWRMPAAATNVTTPTDLAGAHDCRLATLARIAAAPALLSACSHLSEEVACGR
jgi:hypothetical protein